MKILKLEFQNINSLKGTTVVDFESPEYTANGIFLIAGPTGAGKTSIFDAMCLALYGRTPRMSVSKDQNEVLTRGENVCKAELLFEIEGKRYLASWSQSVSPGGILQAARHEISDQTDGGITLASGLTNTKKEIKKLIGLEFDQFRKTVHIVQGEFDEFLNADTSDKMAIFTKITGQGKYERISAKAKEKRDKFKENLKRLGEQEKDISVLPEEERKDLENRIAGLETQKDDVDKRIDENKSLQRWLAEIEDLAAKAEETEKKLAALEEKRTAFIPKAEKLRRALEASAVEGIHGILVTRETHLQSIQKGLEEIKKNIPLREKDLEGANRQFETACGALEQKEREEKDLRPKISAVRTLDGEIETRRKTATEASETVGEKKRLCEEAETALGKVKDEISLKKETLQKIGEYLESHAAEAKLAGSLDAIKNALGDLERQKQRVAEADKKFGLAESELEKARKRAGDDAAKVQSLEKKHTKAREIVEGQERERKTLLDGKTLSDLDGEIETLEREVTEAKVIASLDERRKELEEGKPCPLCGAVYHPYAKRDIPNAEGKEKELCELKEKRKEANRLDSEIRKADENVHQTKLDLTEAKGKAETANAGLAACERDFKEKKETFGREKERLGEKEAEIRTKLREFGLSVGEAIDSHAILDDLNTRLNVFQAKEREKIEVEREIADKDKEEAGSEAALKSAETAHDEAKTACRKAWNKLEAKEKERAEIFGDKNPDVEEERLAREIKSVRDAREAAKEAVGAASNALKEIQDDAERLLREESQTEESRKEAERSFNDALKEKGFENRKDFDDARLNEDERKPLQDEKEALDREEAELNGEMKTRREMLEAKKDEKKTGKNAVELQEELAALETRKREIEENLELAKGKRTQDEDRRRRYGELQSERVRIQKELEKWDDFWDVIGPNLKSFSDYAQSLTFEQVIRNANEKLQLIMPRYLLIRRPEKPKKNNDSDAESGLSLELNVIDRYQGDEQRVIENLSGGERFIISLALALGISRLAEKNAQIDSLFLDEGFGTLDEETLEKAIAALIKISEKGKMIGIITHVEMLQGDDSPIETKIRVKPYGATGHSVVEGPGVTCDPADAGKPGRKPRKKKVK